MPLPIHPFADSRSHMLHAFYATPNMMPIAQTTSTTALIYRPLRLSNSQPHTHQSNDPDSVGEPVLDREALAILLFSLCKGN